MRLTQLMRCFHRPRRPATLAAFALGACLTTTLAACSVGPIGAESAATPPNVAQTSTAFSSALARGGLPVATAPMAGSVVVPASVTNPTMPPPVATATRPPAMPSAVAPSAAAPAMPTAAAAVRVVTVTVEQSVNLRGTPSTTADVLGTVPPGGDAVIVEENVMSPDGGVPWFKVKYEMVTGYLRSDLVNAPHAAMASTTAPAAAGTVTTAMGTGTAAPAAAGAGTTIVATPTRTPAPGMTTATKTP